MPCAFLCLNKLIWNLRRKIVSPHFYRSQYPTNAKLPTEQTTPPHLTNTGTEWPRAAVTVIPGKSEVAISHYDEQSGATARPVKDSFKHVFLFTLMNELHWIWPISAARLICLSFPREHNMRLSNPTCEPWHFWSTLIHTNTQSSLELAWLPKSQATGFLCSAL